MALPLKGIRVLDLSVMLPGPFGTQILADYGAEVIKIEDKWGEAGRFIGPFIDEQAARFYSVNRNKKSLTLDLKKVEARAILKKLILTSDVLLVGSRPGVMEKLGLAYEEVKRINERIIYCALSGFGSTGPLSQLAAHDVNILNLAGITSLTGTSEEPGMSPIQSAGAAGGSLYAVIAILMALLNREKTGQGQSCDVSMLDGAIHLLAYTLADCSAFGQFMQRGQGLLTGGYAHYQIYETSDHKYVSLGAIETKFWQTFCERIDRPQYIPWQLEIEKQADMIADIRALMKEKSQAEWLAFWADDNICFTPVLNLDELEGQPQVQERNMIIKVENFNDTGKDMFFTGLPIKMYPDAGELKLTFPSIGEHTEIILRSLAYTAEEIELFKINGVV